MNDRFKKIVRQPLLHFLLIGGLLFVLYYFINPPIKSRDTIVIDDEQVSRIEMLFEKEWNRKPTVDEMKGLLDKYIQQEVYYRKALTMNLDHNDEIIRRRLDQKLRFVTNDLATLKEPGEAELKRFYEANRQKYLLPNQYSFSHIYFNPDKRLHAKQDAATVLTTLPGSDEHLSELVKKGDAFAFAYHIDSLNEKEIAREMGDAFADTLKTLPLKKWTGPVLSGYGTHLVYMNEIKKAAEPVFAQVKEELLRDYQYNLQQQYNEQLYQSFRKDFDIKFNISKHKYDKKLLSKFTGINEHP